MNRGSERALAKSFGRRGDLKMTYVDDPSLFVADDEMNHAGGIGNPKAVEVFPQLLHFVTARNAIDLQIGSGCFRVLRFKLQPNIRVAQIRHTIDPEPIRTELENATVVFLFDQGQPEGVTIESEHL